jgi:hypothetical protein
MRIRHHINGQFMTMQKCLLEGAMSSVQPQALIDDNRPISDFPRHLFDRHKFFHLHQIHEAVGV